jgi:hypothetical protein
MTVKYETLDEYLDDLDAIKEKIAEETQGMTTKQVIAYFAQSERRLRELTGIRLRVRRSKRKVSTAKR